MTNKHAKALGSAGGKARTKKLTPEERSKLAKKAADVRWKGHKKSTRRSNGQVPSDKH